MAEDRHEGDTGITSYAETKPGNHDIEDCAVEIEKEDRKAGKEEKKGKLDKYRHNSDYPVNVHRLEPLRMESTNPSSKVRTVSS